MHGKTPSTDRSNAYSHSNDAFTYASMLNRQERNPIQLIVGDISRMWNVLGNLHKNRKIAQARINQLEDRVAKVEAEIASVNPSVDGMRLNKFR